MEKAHAVRMMRG